MQRVATGWESELRVAVDTLVPFARVLPLASAFYADCRAQGVAHTRLKLSHEVFGGAWDALAERRADIVLGAPGEPPPGGGYRLRLMAETTMVFAVAPRASARRGRRRRCPKRRSRSIAPWSVTDTSRRLAPRTVGLVAGQDTLNGPGHADKAGRAGRGTWAAAFCRRYLAAPDVSAGPPRHQGHRASHAHRCACRRRGANRVPGNALAWWIAAVERADWRFLALGPVPPVAPRKAPATRRRRVTSGT